MGILYNAFVWLIELWIKVSSSRSPHYTNWHEKLYEVMDYNGPQGIVWIHVASLGEYEQIKPVIDKLNTVPVLLTFFSPSGYNHVVSERSNVYKYYLPPDKKEYMTKVIARVKPIMFIGVRYEYWWNLLASLQDNSIPIIYTNVLSDKKPYFYNWPFKRFQKIFESFDHVFTQNESTKSLLLNLGYNSEKITVSGDSRVERIYNRSLEAPKHDMPPTMKESYFVWGSISGHDVPLMKDVIAATLHLCHIVVPHEVDPKTIQFFTTQLQPLMQKNQSHIIIVDAIGVLFDMYRGADYAYIGGGFEGKVHNTLEPSIFGIPVYIGPDYGSFEEVNQLINYNVVSVVRDAVQMVQYIGNNPSNIHHEEGLNTYLQSAMNATQTIIEKINSYF